MADAARPEKLCDGCGSAFIIGSSQMAALCAECAHHLYGSPKCEHAFDERRCLRCGWDGSRSKYVVGRVGSMGDGGAAIGSDAGAPDEAPRTGDIVAGVVSSVMPFGVFVQLTPAVFGLVRVVDLADHDRPPRFPEVGSSVTCAVLHTESDRDGIRVSLSMKESVLAPLRAERGK
jgi:hypothetical protein